MELLWMLNLKMLFKTYFRFKHFLTYRALKLFRIAANQLMPLVNQFVLL